MGNPSSGDQAEVSQLNALEQYKHKFETKKDKFHEKLNKSAV